MKIKLDYRNPTASHCHVAVFVNGAHAGELILRQEELVDFQSIISHGLSLQVDEFLGTGNPEPPTNDLYASSARGRDPRG